jgi:FkbM family methyltransferase
MNLKTLINKVKIYGVSKSLKYGFDKVFTASYKKFLKNSYSQDGEDLIIDELLNYKKKGTYIDVGANDVEKFSNTKRFYDKGWRGINIEPDYNNYIKFVEKRPEDINLNLGIGTKKGSLKFYLFDTDTLSTFSSDSVEKYKTLGFKVIEEKLIELVSLEEVISKYLGNEPIDFISIDTEGYDLEVLKSNNWEKYRPKLICVENFEEDEVEVKEFLEDKMYQKIKSTKINSIYKNLREESIK